MRDTATLLQALAQGRKPADLIAELAQDDPRLAALAQTMARSARPGDDAIDAGEPFSVEPSRPTSSVDIDALRDRLVELTAEVEQLRERNARCAAALGACAVCWGDDSSCPYCRGRGSSGFATPDEEALRELVIPAVEAYRARRAGRSRRAKQ